MTATMNVSLTETTKMLFLAFARDAANWGCEPLIGGNVGGTKEDRGNITQMKKEGLITTFLSEGKFAHIQFTDKGRAYAAACGVTIGG